MKAFATAVFAGLAVVLAGLLAANIISLSHAQSASNSMLEARLTYDRFADAVRFANGTLADAMFDSSYAAGCGGLSFCDDLRARFPGYNSTAMARLQDPVISAGGVFQQLQCAGNPPVGYDQSFQVFQRAVLSANSSSALKKADVPIERLVDIRLNEDPVSGEVTSVDIRVRPGGDVRVQC